MKSCSVFLLIVVLTVLSGSYVLAQDNDAAACYVEGDRQWTSGNIDGAITQWTQALKLKPSSSLTKDRLIEALQRKVVLLTRQLAEAESRAKEAVTRTPTAVPAATAVPVAKAVPAGPTKIDYRVTPEYVYEIWHSRISKRTNVQKQAAWNDVKGCKVQWAGSISTVSRATVSGCYDILIICPGWTRFFVSATVNLTERQSLALSPDAKVKITGILERQEGPHYWLSAAQISF